MNEYFLKKEEKDRAVQEERKKKTIQKVIRWLVILVALTLIGWPIYSYFKTASNKASKPAPGTYFQAQSRDHIDIGAEHPAYNSNPPTGGWHYDAPAQTGIYDKEFPDEQLIHNLEHSHVWIAHKPDLSSEQIAGLLQRANSEVLVTVGEFMAPPIWQTVLKARESCPQLKTILVIGYWVLFIVWCLEFGVWLFAYCYLISLREF